MPLDPESAKLQGFRSLQRCLVEGDPEQCVREQRSRRKALVASIFLQASLLAGLILAPLFAKPMLLGTEIVTPVPAYRQVSGRTHTTQVHHGNVRHVCVTCFNSRPTNPVMNNRLESSSAEQPIDDSGLGPISIGPCPSCINIANAAPPAPVIDAPREKKRVTQAHIDPALLIYRVEPVYPPLARQIGRAGRIELRAIIAIDGTIQSLRVVSGDPLFYQSALEAVRQWRYRPTVLNGEPVEIDTFITVIYNMDR